MCIQYIYNEVNFGCIFDESLMNFDELLKIFDELLMYFGCTFKVLNMYILKCIHFD